MVDLTNFVIPTIDHLGKNSDVICDKQAKHAHILYAVQCCVPCNPRNALARHCFVRTGGFLQSVQRNERPTHGIEQISEQVLFPKYLNPTWDGRRNSSVVGSPVLR